MPVPQRDFPPDFHGKSRLEFYASLFNSLEINSSFYKLPKAATVKKWNDLVPDNFKFTLKLSKSVTHVKGLEFLRADVESFMEVASQIENKKGCILLQFPPGLQKNLSKLDALFSIVKESDPCSEWTIAVEFRQKSWYTENVYRLLENYKVCLVTHDKPGSIAPVDEYESDSVYLRFHGPGGNYRGRYEDELLSEYAGYINDWEREGKTVYVYFNNTMGDAMKNLIQLNQYIGFV